jgi:hypothetical protein
MIEFSFGHNKKHLSKNFCNDRDQTPAGFKN